MTNTGQDKTRKTLREVLTLPGKKDVVVADCVALVDDEVASKRGVSSLPVKGGYRLVKSIKPGFVTMAAEHLLPEFADALDPLWVTGLSTGKPVEHLLTESGNAAEALLGVTDRRIVQASAPVRGAYNRLRASAKRHVEAAIPGLARIIEKHAD